MKKYIGLIIAGLAISACTQLGKEDSATLAEAHALAKAAKEQSIIAAEEAKRAADAAEKAASAAEAANQKADKIFRTSQQK